MSCEQCRSDPDGPYTGMVCDWCQELIGRPEPLPSDRPSYSPDLTGRWHSTARSTAAKVLHDDANSTLESSRGRSVASLRAWYCIGLVLSLILLIHYW
jgi:hypothetical protein